MRLNLKSFEACIEKIADGMALDEALELIARGDPIAGIAQEGGTQGDAVPGAGGSWRSRPRQLARTQQALVEAELRAQVLACPKTPRRAEALFKLRMTND